MNRLSLPLLIAAQFAATLLAPPMVADDGTRRLAVHWETTLGHGRGQIAIDDGIAFVSILEPWTEAETERPESERPHREAVVALDTETGIERWRHTDESGFLSEQQTFGGRPRAPQSTPMVDETRVFAVGFTGRLRALDRQSGELLWSKDLPKLFRAVPVSFGYSASLLRCDDLIVVTAGGDADAKTGGLVAIDADDGRVAWNLPFREASYATPVNAVLDGVEQIVVVTRNRVFAASMDGRLLWQQPIAKSGMTNVPTPLVVADGIIVSGQGFDGTARWTISRDNGGRWDVAERWRSDAQFFYCNWKIEGETILGCDGKLLQAIDVDSGKRLGRWRGFADANLASADGRWMLMNGSERLSRLRTTDQGIIVDSEWQMPAGRCWTSATCDRDEAGVYGLFRLDDRIVRVGDDHHRPGSPLPQSSVQRRLAWQSERRGEGPSDVPAERPDVPAKRPEEPLSPVQRIVRAIERDGVDAGLDVYAKVREDDALSLDLSDRQRLHHMAQEADLREIADMIVAHAYADLPSERTAEWVRDNAVVVPKDEPDRSVTENGLVYVRFGFVNLGSKLMQAEVRGPTLHPFGYGMPLPPGKVRTENWPVGTVLRDNAGRRLFEVTTDDAGKLKELR